MFGELEWEREQECPRPEAQAQGTQGLEHRDSNSETGEEDTNAASPIVRTPDPGSPLPIRTPSPPRPPRRRDRSLFKLNLQLFCAAYHPSHLHHCPCSSWPYTSTDHSDSYLMEHLRSLCSHMCLEHPEGCPCSKMHEMSAEDAAADSDAPEPERGREGEHGDKKAKDVEANENEEVAWATPKAPETGREEHEDEKAKEAEANERQFVSFSPDRETGKYWVLERNEQGEWVGREEGMLEKYYPWLDDMEGEEYEDRCAELGDPELWDPEDVKCANPWLQRRFN